MAEPRAEHSNAEAAEQGDFDEMFQKKLLEERQRELAQVRNDGNVKSALRKPVIWAQLAANLELKQYRVKRGRHTLRQVSPEDAPEVGWAATRGEGKARIMHDQMVELDGLRSQGVVQSKLRDPDTRVSARKLFSKRRRQAYRRARGARNVLISKEGDEELSKMMRQRSKSFVEHLFMAPSRPRRVLNRLTTAECESIAAAEMQQQRPRARQMEAEEECMVIGDSDQLESKQSWMQKQQQPSAGMVLRRKGQRKSKQLPPENSHQKRSSRGAIPRLMEKLISREHSGAIPDSAFTGTDNEQTPTATPVPVKRGFAEQPVATSNGRPGEKFKNRHIVADSGLVDTAAFSVVDSFKEEEVALRSQLPPAPNAAIPPPTPPPPHSSSNFSKIPTSPVNADLDCAIVYSQAESTASLGNTSEECNDEAVTESPSCSSQVSSPIHPSSMITTYSTSLEVLTHTPSQESSSSGIHFQVRQEFLSSAQSSASAVEVVSTGSFSSSLMEQSSSDMSIGGTPLLGCDEASPLSFSPVGVTAENPLCHTPEMPSSHRKMKQTPTSIPYRSSHRASRVVPPPKEAMSDPGFLTYLERSCITHPTREDYVTYHLNVFADFVELKRGPELEHFMREMVITAMESKLTYLNFYQATHQLVTMAKDVQEKALLIGVFGRALCGKLPTMQKVIEEFTVQAVQDMATDFLSLFPTMGAFYEDSETVMQDEGWGEVFEVARSKGDVRENLLQVLDSDSMHLELAAYNPSLETPPPTRRAFTIARTRADHSCSPHPVHRGLSGTTTSKRKEPPLRRSRSVEVLISYSYSKDDSGYPFEDGVRDIVGNEATDGGVERVERSATPSLFCEPADSTDYGRTGVLSTTLNEDCTRPRAYSVSLQPLLPQSTQRPRFHSESGPPAATVHQRRTSLHDVVVAVVPFLPAATVALKVGVYAAIKAFSK